MKKKIRRTLAHLLVKLLIVLTRVLPRRGGLWLFGMLGSLAFRICRRDREQALRNVELAFPKGEQLIHGAVVKGVFTSLGRNIYDAMRLTYLSRKQVLELVTVEGEENLREPYERGNGVIALTGHIGCWELLAAYFSERDYTVNVIARDLHDSRLNEILVEMRKRHGVESFPRGGSAVGGYRTLRRGKILGMLIDQDIEVNGVFVPFFGRPAHTAVGAAAFALRSGAAIVPLAIHMQPGGHHHVTVLAELEKPPAALPEEQWLHEMTARCSEAVEKLIRIYPQQWVWFHERWRRQPDGRDGVVGPAGERMREAGCC